MAQHAPSLATNRNRAGEEDRPNRMRPEAVAMRRIIADRGFWLSPLMADAELPTLTDYEQTADLLRLDHNRIARERAAIEGKVLTNADKSVRALDRLHKPRADVGLGVLDVSLKRAKAPSSRQALRQRQEQRAQVAAIARETGKSVEQVQRELALQRVTAIAEQKAAAEAAEAERKAAAAARRAEQVERAQARHAAKLAADPEAAERKREARRQRTAAARAKLNRPLPTAAELRAEAVNAAAIEAARRSSRRK